MHPDEERALDPIEVRVDDPPAEWTDLLRAAQGAVPGGAWPLGPGRHEAGLRIRLALARGTALSEGFRWKGLPDPSWPEPVREVVRTAWDEAAGRASIPALRAPWMRRGWWDGVTDWV